MKELFSDVLQKVIESELEDKLGYEKTNTCRIISKNVEKLLKRQLEKNSKMQLRESDVKIFRDRNGKYDLNEYGIEEKIIALAPVE